ncbi:hypothetical protein [Amycolatopsis sp. NPDC059021]|uniref:hypothetical protein n=1 Tax=Amycolatopsis sp. NPDC059021 TaxID=3346704 RepID=UPI00366CBD46
MSVTEEAGNTSVPGDPDIVLNTDYVVLENLSEITGAAIPKVATNHGIGLEKGKIVGPATSSAKQVPDRRLPSVSGARSATTPTRSTRPAPAPS